MSPSGPADRIGAALGRALDLDPGAPDPVSGGSLSTALRFDPPGHDPIFVKTSRGATAGEAEAEAAGLAWLSEFGDVATPGVLAARSHEPAFLALEWIEAGQLDPAGEEDLGRGLAAMHGRGADAHGCRAPASPLDHLRLGSVELSLEPSGDWNSFYVEQRLLPLASRARDRGALSQSGADAIERVCGRIDDLAGPPEPASRLHGDLWAGNVLAGRDGQARLIDPAAQGGHREVDLAMLELFGPRRPRLWAAYEEVAPLADGHRDRVALWQLQPLLIHAVLFGGGYGASAERAARGYLERPPRLRS